jgi:hypothetical protein
MVRVVHRLQGVLETLPTLRTRCIERFVSAPQPNPCEHPCIRRNAGDLGSFCGVCDVRFEPKTLNGSVRRDEPAVPWEDAPSDLDAEIDAAHPLRTGDHARYRRAAEMIRTQHSKYALIDLVNWLPTKAGL